MRILAENSYGRESGSTLIIDPLEFISESSDFAMEYEGGCVELKRVMSGVLSVPFREYTTTDANLRPIKKSNIRWDCKITYWTNEAKIRGMQPVLRGAGFANG